MARVMFFAFAEISRGGRVYMPEEDEIDFRTCHAAGFHG
jgi:hypothetical protein